MIAINIDGKIKTYSTPPETWKYSDGTEVTPYQYDEERQYEDGFRDFVTPTNLTAGQKLGAMIYDATNDVFTYSVVSKSPADLDQETASQKETTRNEIREKHEKRTVENSIALSTDADAYFYLWTAGAYQIDQIRRFNSKTYRNTVEGNINAPDKGGWIEIK